MKLNKQIFGWMGVTALLLITACSNDNLSQPTSEDIVSGKVYGNGNKVVTLTLNPKSSIGTRAGETHISDGTKAKKLYFQVYEVTESNGTKTYTTFVEMEDVIVASYPYTIRLAVDETKNYAIAVWAQNATTNAFTVNSLEDITVDYTIAYNAKDLADAFCVTQEFAGDDEKLNVYLHRPFAQLNVGTSGADYNQFVDGNIRPNKTITYSKIEVDGVYNQIDVLRDEIKKKSDFDGKAVFNYELIPSLYEQTGPIADYKKAFSSANGSRDEEFLIVKLNDDSETVASNYNQSLGDNEKNLETIQTDDNHFLGYKTTYPTMDEEGNYLTEKFRYLSMCYVLVPNKPSEGDQFENWPGSSDTEHDIYGSSTIDEVRVFFAQTNKETGEGKPAYANGYQYLTVKNVPAHRNWRTNLLGGLWYPNPGDPDDPDDPGDDPEDPDDPSSLFANMKILVNICPIYFDEYNGKYESTGSNHWSGIGQGNFPSGTEDDDLHKEPHNSASGD